MQIVMIVKSFSADKSTRMWNTVYIAQISLVSELPPSRVTSSTMPSARMFISLTSVSLILFCCCGYGLAQNLAQVRAALARGGRSVCPYCWACVHQWNCNRPCRPSYRDYCALCPYRFHCRTTCLNLCPFPETPAPTTPLTTTAPPTTTTLTSTTSQTTTPRLGPCNPNRCPPGDTCRENGGGGFICDLGDRRCTGRWGRCQSDLITCPGGYASGLCSALGRRRCCLPEGDRRCNDLQGMCQSDSISCAGSYRSGLCSGSADRRCCLTTATTPPSTTPPTTLPPTTPPSTNSPPSTTPAPTTTRAMGTCSPNPCPPGDACQDHSDGTFECTCPPNLQPCDSDRKCTNLQGTCQSDSNSCPGGYRSGLCSGSAGRRCCMPAGDRRCTNVQGTCQSSSISCPGGYRSGMCSGSADRRCCLPSDDTSPCVSSSEMSQLQEKLIEYEGIRYTAYDAQPTNSYVDWTICVGFNLKRSGARSVFNAVLPGVNFNSVYAGTRSLNRNQCLALFENDLTATYIPLGRRVAGSQFCNFPMNVKIAVVNAVYRGDLAYGHNTARYIRAGNWCSVAAEYLDNQDYINCRQRGLPGVCTRMDWNAAQFRSMCRRG